MASTIESLRASTQLLQESVMVLRGEVRRLKEELATRDKQLLATEKSESRFRKRVLVESSERDVMYGAVAVLAERVGSATQADKNARATARKALTDAGIKPPRALGSARPGRKSGKKKKSNKVKAKRT